MLSIRFCLSYFQFKIAFYIRKQKKQDGKKVRLPYTAILELLTNILTAISFIAYGLNRANSSNGSGPALFLISTVPYYIGFMLSCIKIIHLGDRVIPRTLRKTIAEGTSPTNNSKSELSSIHSDIVLMFAFGGMFISIILAIVFQVGVNISYYPGTSDTWTRLGMAFQGLFFLLSYLVIYRQTHRVVHYIESVHKPGVQQSTLMEPKISNASSSEPAQIATITTTGVSERVLQRTVSKLKYRSFWVGIASVVAATLFLVCVFGVYYHWYLLIMFIIGSLIGSIPSTLMYKPSSLKLCCLVSSRLRPDGNGSPQSLTNLKSFNNDPGTATPNKTFSKLTKNAKLDPDATYQTND